MQSLHRTISAERSSHARRSGSRRWWMALRLLLGVVSITMVLGPSGLGIAAGSLQDDDGDGATSPSSPAGAPVVVPAFRKANHVAVLTIEGAIDRVTLRSLERRVEEAVANGADAIVFDINTPGGEVTATLDICHLIKNDVPANSVAWINHQAYSAGIYIALSCREIVLAPNSRLGDAAPVTAVPIPVTERAKIESPLLQEVVDSARRRHYDENLVQSFVSAGIELWLIENTSTGQRIFVDRAEYETVFGEAPPSELIPVQTDEMKNTQAAPITLPMFDQSIPQAESATEQTLTEEEKRERFEFSQSLPPSRQRLTEADRGQWTLVRQVVTDDRLLTLNQDEAVYYGLAQTIIANDEELKRFFAATTLTRYDRDWSESLVRFLINPYVRMVLIALFIICLVGEMAAPGVGAFGAGALVSLGLLIGAPFLVGLADWWDILFIFLGLILIAFELFLIPGTTIAGIGGVACLLVGLVGTFVSGDIGSEAGQEQLMTGIIATLASLFIAGVGVWMLTRYFDSFPFLNRIILTAEVGDGSAVQTEMSVLQAMGGADLAVEIGDIGVTTTDLRPAGRAEFNGRLLDVKSVGPFVDPGQPIRVVRVAEFDIEVEPASQEDQIA